MTICELIDILKRYEKKCYDGRAKVHFLVANATSDYYVKARLESID